MLNDSMKVFVTVAETKNFSKAAKALHLTQPAVSFQIQTLEQYYGTVLFNRVNRNITLTGAGELLLEYALHMKHLRAQLEKEMQELTGKVKGRLLVGASTTIGEYVLPYLVGGFKKQFPEVEVAIEISNTHAIEEGVLNNRLDLGLVEGSVDAEKLTIENFIDDELILITASDHPWVTKGEITSDELKDYPFISRELGSGTRSVIETTLLNAGITKDILDVNMALGSTTAIKSVVESGLGVSIISRWAAKEFIRLKKLASVAIKDLKFKRKFILIFSEDKFKTQAIDEFVRYLRTEEVAEILND